MPIWLSHYEQNLRFSRPSQHQADYFKAAAGGVCTSIYGDRVASSGLKGMHGMPVGELAFTMRELPIGEKEEKGAGSTRVSGKLVVLSGVTARYGRRAIRATSAWNAMQRKRVASPVRFSYESVG